MLIIDDFNELLALNKLLRKVRFSASLDSEDIEQFAPSPFIASLSEKVTAEFLRQWDLEFPNPSRHDLSSAQQRTDWLNDALTNIEQRITEWPESTVRNVRECDRAQVTELAKVYLMDTGYSDAALTRLVDFIMQRVRAESGG